MEKSKRFLILVRKNSKSKYRIRRICQELRALKIGFDLVFTNKVFILSDEAFCENKKLDFHKYTTVLSLGTSDENIYLVDLAKRSNRDLKFWPEPRKDYLKDKFYEVLFLDSIQIPVPKTVLLDSLDTDRIKKASDLIGGFPCVVKKVTGASGDYVRLVKSAKEVCSFVKDFTVPRVSGKRNVILQEYIEEARGFDFRVYCVKDRVLGTIKRTSEGNDFRSNVSLGGSAQEFETPLEVKEMSRKIMQESKLLFAGIDFIKSKDGYLAIEINVSANFKAFEAVTRINVARHIVRLLA